MPTRNNALIMRSQARVLSLNHRPFFILLVLSGQCSAPKVCFPCSSLMILRSNIGTLKACSAFRNFLNSSFLRYLQAYIQTFIISVICLGLHKYLCKLKLLCALSLPILKLRSENLLIRRNLFVIFLSAVNKDKIYVYT